MPMVKLLLDNKSPLNATDVSGLTALHHGKSPNPLYMFSLTLNVNTIWTEAKKEISREIHFCSQCFLAIAEGHGDTALGLLKAGAETDKKDIDGHLAIELAPDAKAS